MKTATTISTDDFESLLNIVAESLTKEISLNSSLRDFKAFENHTRRLLANLSKNSGIILNESPGAQDFPDICLGRFGIEVKISHSDSWRTVANSVFEGSRDPDVEEIYVLYGKFGGTPGVRWARYADSVIHVRTSHVPRFEVDIDAKESLFDKIQVPYDDFRALSIPQKMKHIRAYARSRLKPGEHFWWLEDRPENEQEHALPLQVRLYMRLTQLEKRQLRAEAALLCPQVVKPSRSKGKYEEAAVYLVSYHGVLAPQARDLFSAGSVALRRNQKRGGNYILRALQDIEPEMLDAARRLPSSLFDEYWGVPVKEGDRIREWLKMADRLAVGWKPSKYLFLAIQKTL